MAILVGSLSTGAAHAGEPATSGYPAGGDEPATVGYPVEGGDPPTQITVAYPWIQVPAFTTVGIASFMCPADYPYLENRDYAPFGTTLTPGVKVFQAHPEPWPIGVYIGGHDQDGQGYTIGTTGAHDSAANWTWFDWQFQVVLHCVSTPELGYRYS
jgi:hypothetical protein